MATDRRLPFALARDEQVILDGEQLLLGPRASLLGMAEARRRCSADIAVREVDEDGFARALTRVYEDGTDEALEFEAEDGTVQTTRDLLEEAGDAPVIRLVNTLLRRSVLAGASDLHVEPHEDGLRARMRIDGMLQTVLDRSDVPVRRVVSRLKVMAGLDIAETRLPQDGRIQLRLGGRSIDTRVSSLPGNYGERIVLRILDRKTGLMPLDALGLEPEQEAALARISALPNGIVLSTGPTGSGKTTTLYSLLQLVNRTDRNIVTVEDPIEYDLPGISQTQVNAEIGMSFARGLRAALRQDPDVILVGEIRDGETASVASQAALTGHLVFSTLHANGAAAAVVRLRDLGVEDFLIAATLRGVIAQRLLRRVCTDCAETVVPSEAEAEEFRGAGMEVPDEMRVGRGCGTCSGTGYLGRIGVFEILEIDDARRARIEAGAGETDITGSGATSLHSAALALVARGVTDLAEHRRVIGGAG